MDWFRSWHGAPTDNKWLVVDRRAHCEGITPGMVSAVAWALMDYASQNSDRGSVDGFDVETYSAWSGWSEDQIEAILEAMRGKGIITPDNRLAAWEKRQPKREDDSADRVKAFRKRQRVLQDNVTQSNADETHVTQGNAPDKIRSDKNDEEGLAAQRQKALDTIQEIGLFNATMLAQFDDMWGELVQCQHIDWIDDAVRIAKTKNASSPQYALKVLANALHTGKAPGYTNGQSQDADSRPRVPAPPKAEQEAADARQAAYERQIAEQLARAGKI